MIEAGLVGLLADIVGGRMYPVRLPEKPILPAIVYQVIDAPRDYDHDGASGLAFPIIQIGSWAADTDDASGYSQAITVAAAVTAALSGYSGALDDVEVRGGFLAHEADDIDPDTGWNRRRQDWSFRQMAGVHS